MAFNEKLHEFNINTIIFFNGLKLKTISTCILRFMESDFYQVVTTILKFFRFYFSMLKNGNNPNNWK